MAKKSAELKKMWVTVAKASATIAQQIHEAAVFTLEHYATVGKGDTSLCSFAINSMWKTGANRRALIQWFEKHGFMKCETDAATGGVKFTKNKGKDHTKVDLDRANASPYFMDDDAMGRTEDDLKVWSGPDALMSVVRRQRNLEEGKLNDKYDTSKCELLPPDMLDAIENYAKLLKGTKETSKPVFSGTHKATTGEAILKVANG